MTGAGAKPAPQAGKTLVTLVAGSNAAGREAAIAAALPSGGSVAVILEGLADGSSQLAELAESSVSSLSLVSSNSNGADPASAGPQRQAVQIHRIAPGCLCCAGNLVLRVTLNRLLRHPPTRIYISLAASTHIGQLRESLSSAPYDQWLTIGENMLAEVSAEPLVG
jgi:hypothetical protein